jgi:hypothetical protein
MIGYTSPHTLKKAINANFLGNWKLQATGQDSTFNIWWTDAEQVAKEGMP